MKSIIKNSPAPKKKATDKKPSRDMKKEVIEKVPEKHEVKHLKDVPAPNATKKEDIILKDKKEKHILEDSKNHKEIKSLKQMEEKILEKLEESRPQIEIGPEKVAEPEIVPDAAETIHNAVKESKEKKASDINENKLKIEAILFAVGKYLDEESISQLCEIDKRGVKKALEELKKEYDDRGTALMIVQEGNSWKINVRERYLSLVRKIVSDTELSKSVMETLAVIAWKTPIYQNEVVKIRGNKCYDHIEELVNSGFVTKDKKGRSYVLKTTEKFYNYFDIDQKNLQGVMSEAKLPTAQTTLIEEEKPAEQTYSRERLIQTLETIETKSIVQTEEDKTSQKEFLDRIHQKIEDSAKRTDEVIAEIPRPMHQQDQPAQAEVQLAEAQSSDMPAKDEEEIVIDTGTSNGSHHFQKPDAQPQKVKQLTKKQLEKKFKEELQRVKDKGEK